MDARILLVEDDDKLRRALASWLTLAGYRVAQAADGHSALRLLRQQPFAVVVSDIVLGDVDGVEVLRAAAELEERPAVILLTGQGTLETAIAAVRSGAYEYLLKPCDEDLLLDRVRGALERQTAEQQLRSAARVLSGPARPAPRAAGAHRDAIRLGALVVGPSRQRVAYEGRPLRLTPTEYALLRYLAEHAGEICRYHEIAGATHGLDLNPAEARSLLRTHVLNLRAKLSEGYLVSERGVGYMLVDPAAG